MSIELEQPGIPGRRRASIPLRRVVPSLLTAMSLSAGLAAIHFALLADWDRALTALAVAAVFDLLDGGAARLLRAESRFGAVLDSLSDFLSFGIAPAIILHQWMLRDAGVPGLAATLIFVLCAALRLARFTSARRLPTGSPLSRFFIGLPSPAAAAIVLIPVMLEAARRLQFRLPEWPVIVHVVFIAWLMVSRQPCFTLKKLRIRRALVVPLMFALCLAVIAAAKDPWLTGAVAASVYFLTVPLSIAAHGRLRAAAARSRAAPDALSPVYGAEPEGPAVAIPGVHGGGRG